MAVPEQHEAAVAPIAAHLAEWGTPFVELAIFGHGDPALIAARLDGLCRFALRSPLARTLFYQSSVAAVAGVELDDGRRAVIKAHQATQPLAELTTITRLQQHVHDVLGLAPRVLCAPLPFEHGAATIEDLDERGDPARDKRAADVRAAVAASFADVIRALEPFVAESRLRRAGLEREPGDDLWPTPHSRLFDFAATVTGAERIDAVAAAALAAMTPAGRRIVAHTDWRVEHLRFAAGKAVVAYDWQSLAVGREPALAGIAAAGYCADWSDGDALQAPSLEAARAFVADYERAAGRGFNSAERRLCGAAFAYSVAYTARCGHAGGGDSREAGSFRHLVETHGRDLLAL